MENKLTPYESQFSSDDRKQFIAESLIRLRKLKKYAQKEVAGWIGISQATYSAYERGRNEPPAEMLVRLSYLFGVSLDEIVQKARFAKTRADTQQEIDELKKYVEYLKEERDKIPGEMQEVLGNLSSVIEQVEKLNNADGMK